MTHGRGDAPPFTICVNLFVLGVLFHLVLILRGFPYVSVMIGIFLWQVFPYGIGLLFGFLLKNTAISLGGMLAMLCTDVAVYIHAFTDPYENFYPLGGGANILLGTPFLLLVVVLPGGMLLGWGLPKVVVWHQQALCKGNWRGRICVAVCWLLCVACVMTVRPVSISLFQRSRRNTTRFRMGKVLSSAIGAYNVDYGHFPIYTGSVHKDMFAPLSWKNLELPETANKDAWGTPLYYASRDGDSYSLISYGKDRKPGETTSEFDRDILFVNGQFVE